MTLTGLNNVRYTTGREIGKGGEGSVYELQSHHDLVLKLYNETIPQHKQEKLALMVQMRTQAIEAYAAWPVDVVSDKSDIVCGFVMKKLSGYVPLHHVFGPMDRKKMFPDKGYNFLVHVARNVATAFHKLHEAGLVVGDVNEGNILINTAGIAAFIDCDSFQVRDGDSYHFCEVGVPRYTPPELLKKKTFERVVRTTNTDDFSLAILIFQLLFLGRHPFAGRNRSAGDIDEETAIRQRQFAYSLYNKRKKLSPPQDSLAITSLPDDVVDLFHRAFETDDRPTPAEWIKALDGLLTGMVTCTMSKMHTYPAGVEECPWCAFRKTRGIMYFLDDSYMQANASMNDIEQFINGFKPEKLTIKPLDLNAPLSQLSPGPVPQRVKRAYALSWQVAIFLAVTGVFVGLFVHYAITVFCFLGAYYSFKHSHWVKIVTDEKAARKKQYVTLNGRLRALVRDYEDPPDLLNYKASLDKLQQLIHEFHRLPDEGLRRRKLAEETLYNEELDYYLRRFDIDAHHIPNIGKAKKHALYVAGIWTAADIAKLPATKVPGIGPANEQVLMNWRRQMAADFVYIPDNYRLSLAAQKVNDEMRQLRQLLETRIRMEYQSLNFLKSNIRNRSAILERQIRDMRAQVRQAEINMDAFRKFAA